MRACEEGKVYLCTLIGKCHKDTTSTSFFGDFKSCFESWIVKEKVVLLEIRTLTDLHWSFFPTWRKLTCILQRTTNAFANMHITSLISLQQTTKFCVIFFQISPKCLPRSWKYSIPPWTETWIQTFTKFKRIFNHCVFDLERNKCWFFLHWHDQVAILPYQVRPFLWTRQ